MSLEQLTRVLSKVSDTGRAPALATLRALAPLGARASAADVADILDWLDDKDDGDIALEALALILAAPPPHPRAQHTALVARVRGLALGFGGDEAALRRAMGADSLGGAPLTNALAAAGVRGVQAADLENLTGAPSSGRDQGMVTPASLSAAVDLPRFVASLRALLVGAALALRRRGLTLQAVLVRAAISAPQRQTPRLFNKHTTPATLVDALVQRLALPLDEPAIDALVAMSDLDMCGECDIEEVLYAAGEVWDEEAAAATIESGAEGSESDAAAALALAAMGIEILADGERRVDNPLEEIAYIAAAEAERYAAESASDVAAAEADSRGDAPVATPLGGGGSGSGSGSPTTGVRLSGSAIEIAFAARAAAAKVGGSRRSLTLGTSSDFGLTLEKLSPAAAWGPSCSATAHPLVARGLVSLREAALGALGPAPAQWSLAVLNVFDAFSESPASEDGGGGGSRVPTSNDGADSGSSPTNGSTSAVASKNAANASIQPPRVALALSSLGISLPAGTPLPAAPLDLKAWVKVIDFAVASAASGDAGGLAPLAAARLGAALMSAARSSAGAGPARKKAISRAVLAAALQSVNGASLSRAEALAVAAHAPGTCATAALSAVRAAIDVAFAVRASRAMPPSADSAGGRVAAVATTTATTDSGLDRRRAARRGSNASASSVGSTSSLGSAMPPGGGVKAERIGLYPIDARATFCAVEPDVDARATLAWLRRVAALGGVAALRSLVQNGQGEQNPLFTALDPVARSGIVRLICGPASMIAKGAPMRICAAAHLLPVGARATPVLGNARAGAVPGARLLRRLQAGARARRRGDADPGNVFAVSNFGAPAQNAPSASLRIGADGFGLRLPGGVGGSLGFALGLTQMPLPNAANNCGERRAPASLLTAVLTVARLARVPLGAALGAAVQRGGSAAGVRRIVRVALLSGGSRSADPPLRLLSNVLTIPATALPAKSGDQGAGDEDWTLDDARAKFIVRCDAPRDAGGPFALPPFGASLLIESTLDFGGGEEVVLSWARLPLSHLLPQPGKAPFLVHRVALSCGDMDVSSVFSTRGDEVSPYVATAGEQNLPAAAAKTSFFGTIGTIIPAIIRSLSAGRRINRHKQTAAPIARAGSALRTSNAASMTAADAALPPYTATPATEPHAHVHVTDFGRLTKAEQGFAAHLPFSLLVPWSALSAAASWEPGVFPHSALVEDEANAPDRARGDALDDGLAIDDSPSDDEDDEDGVDYDLH